MEVVTSHTRVLGDLADDPVQFTGPERVELLARAQQVRNWIDAREAALLAEIHRERDDVDAGARDLTQLSQQQANVGFGEARRRDVRSSWTTELPELREALEAGVLGTTHVDEVCLLAERLDPADRPVLRASIAALVADIAPLTPRRARKHLQVFEASLDDDDGQRRLDRQRRANSLRLPRQSDGTTRITGQLDPVSAEFVTNAVDAKVTEMWRHEGEHRGDHAPPDQVLTNDQRRVAALVELIRLGSGADPATRRQADIIVLMDHQTLLGQLSLSPVAKLGSGMALPAAEARKLACDARIIPVVLGGASQPLDVGRAARLATAAQRAALRAAHETCCINGCDVPFDHCEIHHITWWRHGGRSDIGNLAPVCSKHHRLIHDDAWHLTLDEHRAGHLTHRSQASSTSATNAKPARTPPPPRTRARRPPPTAAPPRPLAGDHVRPMQC